jgi:HEAT repeat protein
VMRGTPAVNSVRDGLRYALKDEAPSVRIAAAQALGIYGNNEDLKLVLPVLEKLASPQGNGVYVSMETLNVIDALGNKADSLKDMLKTLPRKDPDASGRIMGVSKLLEKILSSK